ncbi:MAG: phosphoenolpyruvate carboxykinase (ATP), partial [Planctomycetota bacterium]|nr:phosphoenolpyruvate carboxykinase (ATP) [Planctomycetota bacterium]
MPTTADDRLIFLDGRTVHTNLPVADLVEHAVRRGEGHLAANGALNVHTGSRSGRSPGDKYLEDTPGIHGNIDWGKVNQPCTPEQFSKLESIVREYLGSCDDLYRFDGFAGADDRYRCRVSVVAKEAWHTLFASTLFIPSEGADPSFAPDWTIFDAGALELSPEQAAAVGVSGKIAIFQSLERKMVLIVGTRYAGEIKKSIFYAMNHDLP